jgi:hypothetical protein
MEKGQKFQMIEEIKRIERELYLKKSKLASVEAMEYGVTLPSLIGQGLNAKDWEKALSELINLIGMHSTGGDSVEDIQKEREK